MSWNSSHARAYVNSTLCGSTELADDVADGSGWGSVDSNVEPGSMLIGAWRGAPDAVGSDQLGGYFTGLLDKLEVRGYTFRG